MVLVGLGTFLIVIAVVLPTYIAGQVLKDPLNYYYKAVLDSPNTSYFNAAKVTEVTGADVRAVFTFKGNAKAGNSSTGVEDLFSYVYDPAYSFTDGQILITQRTFAFDRKTAQLRNCCGANMNGKHVDQSGIPGYVFPMGTQQKTYQVWDANLLRSVPFSYVGTDTVNGILTYKFTANVPPTKIGFSALSATEPEFYAINVTYWVDPDTGLLLKVLQHQQQFLENAITSARTTTLFDGTLATTPASLTWIVAIDNSGRLKITLIQTILPIVSGVLGAILLVWGILLVRARRSFTESGFAAMTHELAAAAAPPPPDTAPGAAKSAGAGKHASDNSRSTGVVPGLDHDAREGSAEASKRDNPEAPGGQARLCARPHAQARAPAALNGPLVPGMGEQPEAP
jgi:hypothetical protein